MHTKTQFVNWDLAFEDNPILVKDRNNCDVKIFECELLSSESGVNPSDHVEVFYYGQSYWIPQSLHYPL